MIKKNLTNSKKQSMKECKGLEARAYFNATLHIMVRWNNGVRYIKINDGLKTFLRKRCIALMGMWLTRHKTYKV